MPRKKLSRRQFVAATALSSAALITAPYVRGAYAAGKLSIGFWDHWVPGANKASTDIVNAWAEKEKVEVQIDYIPSQGNKNLLTIAAEAQAKSGHDILAMPTWWPHAQAELLEPMNDVVEGLIKQNGEPNGTVKYLGQSKGKWLAVPASVGSQIKGPCSRIDLMKQHAGIDVQALYPAGAPPKADSWTPGHLPQGRRGLPEGRRSVRHRARRDQRQRRYGGRDIPVVRCSPCRCEGQPHRQDRRGAPGARILQEADLLPAAGRAGAWDDSSNNKWLVSGRGAMIMNPPSAWAVAKRDAPQVAEQCWTHGFPAGPKGRYAPYLPYFWGTGRSPRTRKRPRACSGRFRNRMRSRRCAWRAAATTSPATKSSPP